MHKIKKKNPNNKNVLMIVVLVVLIGYSLCLVLPLLWAFMTSFKNFIDFDDNSVFALPNWELSQNEMLFGNYAMVLRNFQFKTQASYYSGLNLDTLHAPETTNTLVSMLWNTIVYALGGAIVAAIIPCIVGYVCAKYRYKFSDIIYAIVVFVMVMPIVGGTPARITLLRRLNLFDSLLGSLIEKLSFTNMYFLVFYAFFRGLPDSYAEAAEVDGASQFRVLVSIMIPLAMKMITTVALILFVQFWNDYNTPFLFLPTHPTLSYAVFRLVVQKNFDKVSAESYNIYYAPAQIAACMLLALPIMAIFIAFKNKLMGNVSLGGIKG